MPSLLLHDPREPLLFNSGTFFLCFTVMLVGYAVLLPHARSRVVYLWAFSYFYYYKCNGVFVATLVATTVLDFLLARQLGRERRPRRRKLLLAASVVVNLGLLGYFKYTGFLLRNLAWLRGTSFAPLDIFLPIGISFYSFQSVSYVVDVYRGEVEPTESLLEYAFFLSFFPQIVAGPIVRASKLLPQIRREPIITRADVGEGLHLVVRGLARKAIVADFVGSYSDLVFATPQAYRGLEVLLGVYAYALQIYFDFSGYSDMAIGMGRMLGYRLPDNFRSPYRARTITDFWRRWHMTLSSWLRDYLFFPLAGRRPSPQRTKAVLFTVFLACGLWHGASWNFVLWGGLHGVLLCAHKLMGGEREPDASGRGRAVAALSWLLTLHLVVLLWVPFRTPDLAGTVAVLRQLVQPTTVREAWQVLQARADVVGMVVVGAAAALAPPRWANALLLRFRRATALSHGVVLLVVIQLVLELRSQDIQPFIYFQF